MLSDMFAFPVSSAITLPSLRELRLGDALSAHSLPPQAADGVQYSEDNHAYTFVVPLPSGSPAFASTAQLAAAVFLILWARL